MALMKILIGTQCLWFKKVQKNIYSNINNLSHFFLYLFFFIIFFLFIFFFLKLLFFNYCCRAYYFCSCYYYYYYLLIRVFHISVSLWSFWSLNDSKSPLVSRTLLSILAVLNNVVVWMVSTRLPTSKSSSPFNNLLVIVSNAPITISIIVTCMFHSFFVFFFNSLARPRYLFFFSHSFSFILWSAGTAKSTILQVLFFC